MTTGLELGTSFEKDRVYEKARNAGFGIEVPMRGILKHNTLENLRLQIHDPSYLSSFDRVVTELEFDDCSDRFPDHPEAMQALRDLYSEIPDLIYLKNLIGAMTQGEKPEAASLSKYLANY